ncbi:MAG: hypothetical protein U0987_09970 [Afipia sp.]|nr:hypothetical protein [Afipia sp.]
MVVMHAGYSDVRVSDPHWPTTACLAVCEVMFGTDYATLMGKAAEPAKAGQAAAPVDPAQGRPKAKRL